MGMWCDSFCVLTLLEVIRWEGSTGKKEFRLFSEKEGFMAKKTKIVTTSKENIVYKKTVFNLG